MRQPILRQHEIQVRTFVLLMPPFMPANEAVHWAVRSVEMSLKAGADCMAIIPTRGGNGLMEQLAAGGQFSPPTLTMLDEAFASTLSLPTFHRDVSSYICWTSGIWKDFTHAPAAAHYGSNA